MRPLLIEACLKKFVIGYEIFGADNVADAGEKLAIGGRIEFYIFVDIKPYVTWIDAELIEYLNALGDIL